MAEPDMQVANPAGAAVEGGEGGDQAQAMPSVFETLKSVATRALIFYFIMSFFKKPAAPPAGPDGTPAPARGAAANLYSEGMGFDMYIYLSEQDDFNDFNVPDSLI